MNILKGIYYFISMVIYAISKEIVFRVLSIVMFPIAYKFEKPIRQHMKNWNKDLIEEVTFKDTRNIPMSKMSMLTRIVWLFWIFLDDSPARDNFLEDGSRMYDSSPNREYYPSDFIYKHKTLRDIWWSFIRNNAVNYVSWNITGGWKQPLEYKTLWGTFNELVDKSDDNSYYVEGIYLILVLHNNGKIYPRFTYVGEVFGKKLGIWVGNSRWSGRFSFSRRW